MSHWDQEKVIKEKRTLEAAKKDLMGNSGKLGFICKILGNSVDRQGSAYMSESFLEDPYDDEFSEAEYEQTLGEGNLGPMVDPGEILEYEGDYISKVGMHFDGLKWGMHLEITNNLIEKKIVATYKGFTVYEEISGDLMRYAPFEEWEVYVEKLYKIAKEKSKKDEPARKEELKEMINKKKKTFLQNFREKWGV